MQGDYRVRGCEIAASAQIFTRLDECRLDATLRDEFKKMSTLLEGKRLYYVLVPDE